ncbi:hypothetical protein [Photorhabdus luminescens]|uniref:Uncharacterized protein n=1 Tax=Photorhabdus luminescens subsp. mexicana TaxID=2100167 RepID=A0A4R4JJU4_PHOLU|nr:hypothetical protein [Photorhabdus luminescens]TDB53379.1 hypothetical protein C5468_06725 [Photorhabdus luminescens subsp. mexicana]
MMTDKEISTVGSLKASFKSGVQLMPEAFSHLIDEAYKAYEIIDGAQGDGPTAGLKRDDKGKLALNVHHSGGLNLDQGALALSLKPEGGISFDGGRRLKLDADWQIQFEDFFSLSRRERMEITQLLGLKRIVMTRIVSPFPKEGFGRSISINEAGDCLAVGARGALYVYTRRKSGEWNTSTPIEFKRREYEFGNLNVNLNAAGDLLAVGCPVLGDGNLRGKAYVYACLNGVWDTENPIVFLPPPGFQYFGSTVSLNAAGNCLAIGGTHYPGVVYMYTRSNGTWDMENPIQFWNPGDESDNFGGSVDLNATGNRLVVSSQDLSIRYYWFYVYECTNGIWDKENPTKFSAYFEDAWFGLSMNEAGDRLARGTIVYRSSAGKVYVFTRTDGGWDMENRIKFLAPESDAYFFGMSAGLNNVGDRLIVGSSSVVYVYKYINNQWDIGNPIKVLNPSSNSGNSDDYDDFDFVIRNAAGTILAVSATSTKVDSASKAGVIYIFENVN